MSTLVFDFQEPMRAFFFPLFAADLTACISDRHFRLRHRSSTLFAASLLPSSEDLASSAAGQCISMASNQLTPHAQTPPHLPQLQTDISSPLAVQSLIHLEQLRETARDYIFKNLYSGAIFFADKAVTISKGVLASCALCACILVCKFAVSVLVNCCSAVIAFFLTMRLLSWFPRSVMASIVTRCHSVVSF